MTQFKTRHDLVNNVSDLAWKNAVEWLGNHGIYLSNDHSLAGCLFQFSYYLYMNNLGQVHIEPTPFGMSVAARHITKLLNAQYEEKVRNTGQEVK